MPSVAASRSTAIDPSLMMRGGPEPVAADHVGAVRAKVRRRGRTRVVAVAGVLAVLLALAALMLVEKPPMPTVDPVLPTSSLGDKRVVAVLPWQDLSRGPATVVWTPQYLRPTLVYVDCRMPGVDDAWRYLIRVSVNGKAIDHPGQDGGDPGQAHRQGTTDAPGRLTRSVRCRYACR